MTIKPGEQEQLGHVESGVLDVSFDDVLQESMGEAARPMEEMVTENRQKKIKAHNIKERAAQVKEGFEGLPGESSDLLYVESIMHWVDQGYSTHTTKQPSEKYLQKAEVIKKALESYKQGISRMKETEPSNEDPDAHKLWQVGYSNFRKNFLNNSKVKDAVATFFPLLKQEGIDVYGDLFMVSQGKELEAMKGYDEGKKFLDSHPVVARRIEVREDNLKTQTDITRTFISTQFQQEYIRKSEGLSEASIRAKQTRIGEIEYQINELKMRIQRINNDGPISNFSIQAEVTRSTDELSKKEKELKAEKNSLAMSRIKSDVFEYEKGALVSALADQVTQRMLDRAKEAYPQDQGGQRLFMEASRAIYENIFARNMRNNTPVYLSAVHDMDRRSIAVQGISNEDQQSIIHEWQRAFALFDLGTVGKYLETKKNDISSNLRVTYDPTDWDRPTDTNRYYFDLRSSAEHRFGGDVQFAAELQALQDYAMAHLKQLQDKFPDVTFSDNTFFQDTLENILKNKDTHAVMETTKGVKYVEAKSRGVAEKSYDAMTKLINKRRGSESAETRVVATREDAIAAYQDIQAAALRDLTEMERRLVSMQTDGEKEKKEYQLKIDRLTTARDDALRKLIDAERMLEQERAGKVDELREKDSEIARLRHENATTKDNVDVANTATENLRRQILDFLHDLQGHNGMTQGAKRSSLIEGFKHLLDN